MSEFSIAIKGNGKFLYMWTTHAMRQFPKADIYDQSAAVTAFRQAEVKLGQQGFLDPAGRASAQRTARNMANPPIMDATLTFEDQTVTVTCKNGNKKVYQVRLTGLGGKAIQQTFAQVDDAIDQCMPGARMA